MRFVPVKSVEQQGQLMQHRARDLLMRQRTQVINALRAHLAELGITAAQGREGIRDLLAIVADDGDARLPIDARASLIVLAAQLQAIQTLIGSIEKRIVARHRSSEASKRLRPFQASAFWVRAPSPPWLQILRRSGLVVILPPGSDLCRDKIRPAANASSVRSPNRAIAICDGF
jgi:transposase